MMATAVEMEADEFKVRHCHDPAAHLRQVLGRGA